MQLVHVVYGEGWFVEYSTEGAALRALDLCTDEGIEAEYKASLQAQYALVVEYFPGSTDIRRHKWAYGEWIKGAPKAQHVRTLRRVDVTAHGTELRRKGQAAHVEYYAAPAMVTPTGSPAARTSQPTNINPFTGNPAPMIAPPCGSENGDYAYMGVC